MKLRSTKTEVLVRCVIQCDFCKTVVLSWDGGRVEVDTLPEKPYPLIVCSPECGLIMLRTAV